MKKMSFKGGFLGVTLLALLVGGLFTGRAEAYPFIETTGLVYPDFSAYPSPTLTGTTTLDVTYRFTVDTAAGGAQMKGLSLEFEGDVFVSVNSFTVASPSGWTITSSTSPAGNVYQIGSAGTTVPAGGVLVANANVTVNNWALFNAQHPTLYNPAGGSGADNAWTEGQIWGQSYYATDTLGGADGGSTAVPEPATLLLLGAGLVGASVVARAGRLRR